MDKKAKLLFEELQKNSDQSMKKLSSKTGLPISTIHNRIKKYKKEGLIKEMRAILDDKKLGNYITAFVLIGVDKTSKKALGEKEIAEKFKGLAKIQEVHILQGTYDIIFKIKTKDMKNLSDFTIGQLRNTEGVSNVDVFVVLETAKDTTEIEI